MSERTEHPVLAYADRAREQLLKGDKARARRLVAAYAETYARLQPFVEALEARWTAESETKTLTAAQLRDLKAYKDLMKEIQKEMARFAGYAGQEMSLGAHDAIRQGMQDARNEVALSLDRLPEGAIREVWRGLADREVQFLLGMTEPESPLRASMERELGPALAQQVGHHLVRAAALGRNPKQAARAAVHDLQTGLNWTLRTFRTAQLWAYRSSKHAAWAKNPDLYKGWVWHARLAGETCAACIAQHGTQHGPTEVLNDHYNGACTPVPITPTYQELLGLDEPIEGDVPPALQIPSGSEWFAQQSAAFQEQVLGGARFRAYQAGAIRLQDLVGSHTDPVYGKMVVVPSLKSVLGGDADKYYAGGPSAPPAPASVPDETEPEPDPYALSERAIGASESKLQADLAETREYYEMSEDEGVKGVLDSLEQTARSESAINEALWEQYGITPEEASADQWRHVADVLEQEGYKAYQRYTKTGILSKVQETRNAKDAGYMMVGGKQIAVRRGAFSVATGRRMQGEMWADAKGEMSEAAGRLLQRAGFSETDIRQASYEQRMRLLEELGQKELMRTKRGTPSRIDAVPAESRERAVEAIDYDLAATCENSAVDPLAMPTIDAYQKMELADQIRAVKLGE